MKPYLILLVPFAFFAMVFMALSAGPEVYHIWVSSQTSIAEMLMGVPLIFTLIVLGCLWANPTVRANKHVRPWLIAYTFSVFYFLGEDQNWGQHYVGWGTPDFFMERNKEHETNLHNMSSWFNQKPRIAMELWVIIAGILVPLGWQKPREWMAKWVPAVLWPDKGFVPLAILTIAITMPERLKQYLGITINPDWDLVRFSELQEFCFGVYMLCYAVMLSKRLRSGDASKPLFG